MCKCGEDNTCKHPEKLQGKPIDCSPEQIEECHGEKKDQKCSCQKDED